MAINPETQYPGKITASSSDYPYGEARNITVPGDGTGTPWEAALVNDIFGFQQRLLSDAGITPTGNPEKVSASQYMDSMETVFPRVFDTYDTELAAYTPLADEQIVYCKGKSSVGDGGAGYYQYDLASTTWVLLSVATNSKLEYKNKIINGNFDLWDYQITQTSDDFGSDNRWHNGHSGSSKTHTQQSFTLGQTDVPGNPKYYSRTVVTTASGVTDYVRKIQTIEDVSTLSGETVTLSFYAKADASRDLSIELVQNFGTGGSPSAEVNTLGVNKFTLTTSWVKYTATAALPSVSGKTLGSNLDDYLGLILWFDAGSNYNSRTDSLGNQSGTFDIARIQLEKGPVATEFEDIHETVTRLLSERYYFHTYEIGKYPGAVDSDGSIIHRLSKTEDEMQLNLRPPTNHRFDVPTITVYSVDGTAGYVYNSTTAANVAVSGVPFSSTKMIAYLALSTTVTDQHSLACHIVLDSEIYP